MLNLGLQLVPGNHKCGEVCGVDGEEDDGEQRPDARHKPETLLF